MSLKHLIEFTQTLLSCFYYLFVFVQMCAKNKDYLHLLTPSIFHSACWLSVDWRLLTDLSFIRCRETTDHLQTSVALFLPPWATLALFVPTVSVPSSGTLILRTKTQIHYWLLWCHRLNFLLRAVSAGFSLASFRGLPSKVPRVSGLGFARTQSLSSLFHSVQHKRSPIFIPFISF